MHLLLMLLLALEGGVFGMMPNDGLSGPPDAAAALPVFTARAASPSPAPVATVAKTYAPPAQYDGLSGPPDHH